MNRDAIIAQACADTGYEEPDDVSYAEGALQKRDEGLWQMGLWKDLVVQVNLTIDPENDEDHAEGVVYLPEVIDRVMGVRTDCNSVWVNALETFYRVDLNQFNSTGIAVEFAKLRPGWFTWRGIGGLVINNNIADNEAKIKPIYLLADNQEISAQVILNNGVPVIQNSLPSVVVSGAGTESANGVYYLQPNGQYLAANGNYIDLSSLPFAMIDGQTTAILYYGDALIGQWGEAVTGDAPSPTVAYSDPTKIEIAAVYKPVTQFDVVLNPFFDQDSGGGTLLASVTRSPIYQRIRLFPIPQRSTLLRVLGKSRYIPLDFAYQEPQITGSELYLMAILKFDLYTRGGQNGTAQGAIQEAQALLQTLKDCELVQEAHYQQIIPAGGLEPDYSGPNYNVGLIV